MHVVTHTLKPSQTNLPKGINSDTDAHADHTHTGLCAHTCRQSLHQYQCMPVSPALELGWRKDV